MISKGGQNETMSSMSKGYEMGFTSNPDIQSHFKKKARVMRNEKHANKLLAMSMDSPTNNDTPLPYPMRLLKI